MKNWNKTGKIKALLLVIFSIPNLLAPIDANPDRSIIFAMILPVIFASIAIFLFAKFNHNILDQQLIKPNWNDNPISLKNSFSFFQFGAFVFLVIGLSMVIGTWLTFQEVNQFGLTSISIGIGILIGIYLALNKFAKQN